MFAPSVPCIVTGLVGISVVDNVNAVGVVIAGSAVGGVNLPVTVLQASMKIAPIIKYKDGGSVFFILLSFNFL
jgi:hypothetical protein